MLCDGHKGTKTLIDHSLPPGSFKCATHHSLTLSFPAPGMPTSVRHESSAVCWSADGRHLFLLKRGGSNRAAILRLDTSGGRTETWRELKTPDPIAVFPDPIIAFFHSVVLSSDGQAYAFSYQRDLATLYLVKGVR
jgi:hypothetical protein